MKILRIITGILLGLVVSTVNRIAGIGYTIGGEFELIGYSMSAQGKTDSRFVVQRFEDQADSVQPRSPAATLSLLFETKYGRFGLCLQIFCWVQFVAGLIVIFKKQVGAFLTVFLLTVGFLGLGVEGLGSYYTSSVGITNYIGITASMLLLIVTVLMAPPKHSDGSV